MNYILIPCTSSAPDRAHDAVVLRVDETLLATLRTRRDVFAAQSADSDLHAHEYRDGPLHYLHLDDDLDAPEGPVVLTEHLEVLELFGSWHLEDAPHVYLSVVADTVRMVIKDDAERIFTRAMQLEVENQRLNRNLDECYMLLEEAEAETP